MSGASLDRRSIEELVDRYAATGVAQDEAELNDDIGKYNRLVDDIIAVEAELKSRAGDQRTALMKLYDHPNMQVRLNAAHATLAVAPEAARALLMTIRESRWMPQAMQAGMSLRNLENGVYRPD
ncbi:DUF2019 domain-containing protein [Bauldia litoralis]|uniref:DUF2019 domain-containing protein n=1 Tax=Bauldia litoralis TaxID=665467 RepID=A0A1G6CF61_9HYPH|nr:DUF2019 domain-containing protein [Bauldia litoralis]SDB31528.1 protein of unknown function [Bauldia litoralis]